MPTVRRKSRPVLVGEANPYGGDPYYALYPSPDGCSGHRLCCIVLGMSRAAYLRTFERVNLCPHEWDRLEAERRAEELRQPYGRYILLGAKVSRAFGLEYTPFSSALRVGYASGFTTSYLVLPHPSGLCRLWNEPGAFGRAREAVGEFLPEIRELLGVGGDDGNS